ncbi:MAG: FG-GAP-like repeat-containing protein [Flavobacteriaceae bacterium]
MKKPYLFFFSLAICISSYAQVTFTSSSPFNTSYTDRAVVDMNGDFLDDVVSVNSTHIQIFYQQPGGSFNELNISTSPADNTPSWSLAAGDYDDNGYTDLLYGGGNGVTLMRANNNGTAFTEISYPQFVFSQRSNFVDINNDGHLDAFVCHDVAPNVYYLNDGNGDLTFHQGGIGDYPTGGHYGSVWIDYDNDGDMDMFNAKCNVGGDLNDRSADRLHNNDGSGTFTEVAQVAGLYDEMQTWSSAWADYDNDGYMDVFVGSSAPGAPHKLKRNNGDGTFTDISAGTGINALTSVGIENCTYDFDNNGYADILSNGNLLLNNGDLTFTLFSNVVPSDNGALGDLNNDGFIDAFVNGNVYFNNGNTNHWLTVNTIGVESNRNGIGARVQITSALGTQIRDVRSGEGFRFMSTLNTHFGLGADTEITTLTIIWPSGIIDVMDNVAVDQVITIEEGSTILGLEDTLVNNLISFPNPTSEILNIASTSEFTNPIYSIFDMNGKRVMNEKLNSSSINVSYLAEGNYILKVADTKTVKTQRFIKK